MLDKPNTQESRLQCLAQGIKILLTGRLLDRGDDHATALATVLISMYLNMAYESQHKKLQN